MKIRQLSHELKSSEQFLRQQHPYRELSTQLALSAVMSLNDVSFLESRDDLGRLRGDDGPDRV